ncbi:MAG: DoxX family protein [Pseudomonadota bacterium]
MRFLTWTAMGLTTLVMLAGGAAKLTAHPLAHMSFSDLGLPAWFGYFIGVCELLGAAGLWFRQTSQLAAIGIGAIMLGAIYYHLSYPPLPAGLPALLVLTSVSYIATTGGAGRWDLPLPRAERG